MATSSVILNIKANTDRALNDFKKFSAQLDNKFLMSGLKLDVVRNALGQINREFQKAIGEQGLQAGQSLRAAENQVALLSQTFKGFSSSASLDMATQFSTAFSEIAVKAGGTAKDIQKALAATPFISTNLSEDMRKALGEGILNFQRDFRRAGLSEDFAGIARQFLMGQLTAEQMINSGDTAQQFFGDKLSKITGQIGYMGNAQERSEAVLKFVQDQALIEQVGKMAKSAGGFKAIIEDLNTKLFNPKKGIFGSLREVTMAVDDKTTILDETTKLIDSVFGRQGLFVNFFQQVGKIFGIEDPLKVVINGVRWITRQINALNKFIQSPEMQGIIKLLEGAFKNIKEFVTKIYNTVSTDLQNPDSNIRKISDRISNFFKGIHEAVKKAWDDEDTYLYSLRMTGDRIKDFISTLSDAVNKGDWDPRRIYIATLHVGINIVALIEKLAEDVGNADFSKQITYVLAIVRGVAISIGSIIGILIRKGLETLSKSSSSGQLLTEAFTIVKKFFTVMFANIFNDYGPGKVVGWVIASGVFAALGKKLILGITGLGAGLIAALPGGQLINKLIKSKLTSSVTAFGNALSNAVRSGINKLPPFRTPQKPYPGSEYNSRPVPTPTRGAENMFQRKVLAYLNAIVKCVCGPSPFYGPERKKPPVTTRRPRPIPPPRPSPTPVPSTKIGKARMMLSTIKTRISKPSAKLTKKGMIGDAVALGAGGLSILSGSNPDASNVLTGASKGAMMGMMFGPKGMLAGALIGGITTWISDLSKSSDKVKAILEPLGDAFGLIMETIGPTFKSLWDVLKSTVSIILAFFPMFGGLKKEGDSTTKAITGLKIILTPVVLAFQLIEQVANALAWAFKGTELGITKFRVWINDLMPGESKEDDVLRKRVKTLESELNDVGGRMLKAHERNKEFNKDWFDVEEEGTPRAAGGIVEAGRIYDFQENGRELLIPNVNGSVMNNATLSSLLSRRSPSPTPPPINATFNITFKVDGVLGIETINQLRDPVVAIVEEAWGSATAGTVNRGTVV